MAYIAMKKLELHLTDNDVHADGEAINIDDRYEGE